MTLNALYSLNDKEFGLFLNRIRNIRYLRLFKSCICFKTINFYFFTNKKSNNYEKLIKRLSEKFSLSS